MVKMVNLQKLAKSEEENVAGNYFKPHRASKLMEQAQLVKKCKKCKIFGVVLLTLGALIFKTSPNLVI